MDETAVIFLRRHCPAHSRPAVDLSNARVATRQITDDDVSRGAPRHADRAMIMPTGAFRADGSLNVVVETPRGAVAKFKYDEESGMVTLSRALPLGVLYPY